VAAGRKKAIDGRALTESKAAAPLTGGGRAVSDKDGKMRKPLGKRGLRQRAKRDQESDPNRLFVLGEEGEETIDRLRKGGGALGAGNRVSSGLNQRASEKTCESEPRLVNQDTARHINLTTRKGVKDIYLKA